MNYFFLLILMSSVYVCVWSIDYTFGERTPETQLVYRQKVEYVAIPWKKRVKYFFYNDLSHLPIKAMVCSDLQRTEASINVTAGGVGYDYATLRMKSQRSYGLEYIIEIYV